MQKSSQRYDFTDVRKPRIAVIYTHFPHYRAAVFSELAKSRLYEFCFYYDPSGVDNTIINGPSGSEHFFIRTHRVGQFFWQRSVMGLALSSDIDGIIFLGNPLIISTWLATVIARLHGRSVFFWTHGWLRERADVKSKIRNLFYRLANGLLVYGNRAKNIGASYGFCVDRIHVINNSLDYLRQKEIRERQQDAKREIALPYFLCVSRLIASAELGLAIEAMGQLAQEAGYSAELVIVGDGPEQTVLQVQAERQGAPVRFLGAIYEEERLANLFMNCAAVVSPGKVGLLAMHAMAYGAPVITHGDMDHQMPEVEAIIPGRTGQFFRRSDAGELAATMKYYLARGRSEAEQKVAIETIEQRWNPASQRRLIEQALDHLLEGRKSP